MEQQRGEKPHLKHLDDIIGAHEVAESVVPFAAVVPQDKQVGAGMEQQEETQESAQCADEDFLRDGVDFGEVHAENNLSAKVVFFRQTGKWKQETSFR